MNEYQGGAYYYNELEFRWEYSPIVRSHSIYAIKESSFIWMPYLRTFINKYSCRSIYIPFINNNVIVKLNYELK